MMTYCKVTYRGIGRKVFTKLCERLESDREAHAHVVIYYTGTNLYGELIIDGCGYEKEFRRVLTMFDEIYYG